VTRMGAGPKTSTVFFHSIVVGVIRAVDGRRCGCWAARPRGPMSGIGLPDPAVLPVPPTSSVEENLRYVGLGLGLGPRALAGAARPFASDALGLEPFRHRAGQPAPVALSRSLALLLRP